MPFMTRIPSDLARFGLTVELAPGWESRGSSAFNPGGVTCHWTAGPKNAADKARPSLNVCINGRPGIPGPLCNIYLARDGTCVVVAAGRANHAGVGGFRGLVGNSAVYGIEAESGGDGDWSKSQLKEYPRLVAALLSGINRDASWAHGHHEWAPTRKIDIRDIMPSVRSAAAAHLANPSTGDDMSAADVKAITDHINYRIDQLAGFVKDTDKANRLWTNQRFNDVAGHVTGRTAEVTTKLLEAIQQIDGVEVSEEVLRPLVEEAVGATSAQMTAEAADKAVEDIVARLERDDAAPAA